MAKKFPDSIRRKLGTYVYRLIDPRNGETFYIGKGKGNRVFAHANAEIPDPEASDKIRRIHEIRNAGFEVSHVVHRHGMDDDTAYEVEAALIDAYPGLTNIAGGTDNSERGAMHADEIVRSYKADIAKIKHRVMFIIVNRSAVDRSYYEAARYAWKINRKRAQLAEFVFAVQHGIIKDVFVPHQWLRATEENFPERTPNPKRYGFVGERASSAILKQYVNKQIPSQYRKKGAASPVKYTYNLPSRSRTK